MNLKYSIPLIGVDDKEDYWLTEIKHSKIKIERTKYLMEELIKKYDSFDFRYKIPIYFDYDNNGFICYELIYEDEINEDKIEGIQNDILDIFNKCKTIVEYINTCFGTVIDIDRVNTYIEGKEIYSYTNEPFSRYNPTILEDYSKMPIDDESNIFIETIEAVINRKRDDLIFNTFLKVYNSNISIFQMEISFLNLITCLEILFEKETYELSYQVSRGVSVLLSSNKEEGKELFKKMKKLYNLRSKFVHTGIFDLENYYKLYYSEPFEDLKILVIRCFRKYIRLGLQKEDFIDLINSSGYGDIQKM